MAEKCHWDYIRQPNLWKREFFFVAQSQRGWIHYLGEIYVYEMKNYIDPADDFHCNNEMKKEKITRKKNVSAELRNENRHFVEYSESYISVATADDRRH